MAVGSDLYNSSALLARTPNPSAVPSNDKIITPSYLREFSDILAIWALRT